MQKKFFLGVLLISAMNIFAAHSSTTQRAENLSSPMDPLALSFGSSTHASRYTPIHQFERHSPSPLPEDPRNSRLRPLERIALFGEDPFEFSQNLSESQNNPHDDARAFSQSQPQKNVLEDCMPKSDETHRDPRFPTRSTTPVINYTQEDLDYLTYQVESSFTERQRLFSEYLRTVNALFLESTKDIPGKRKRESENAHTLAKRLTNKELNMLTNQELKDLDYKLRQMQEMNLHLFDDNYLILQYIITSKLKK